MKAFYNFEQMHLTACQNPDCTFSEFIQYVESQMFDHDTIEELCYGTGYTEALNEAEDDLRSIFH